MERDNSILEFFQQRKMFNYRTALRSAVTVGNIQLVDAYLSRDSSLGKDEKGTGTLWHKVKDSNTPRGLCGTLKKHIPSSIDDENEMGLTPLFQNVIEENVEAVAALVQSGADVTKKITSLSLFRSTYTPSEYIHLKLNTTIPKFRLSLSAYSPEERKLNIERTQKMLSFLERAHRMLECLPKYVPPPIQYSAE